MKSHNRASKDTISRWIRPVMTDAGIDVSMFEPHSTSAAAASKAINLSLPVQEILHTADWSSERTLIDSTTNLSKCMMALLHRF